MKESDLSQLPVKDSFVVHVRLLIAGGVGWCTIRVSNRLMGSGNEQKRKAVLTKLCEQDQLISRTENSIANQSQVGSQMMENVWYKLNLTFFTKSERTLASFIRARKM